MKVKLTITVEEDLVPRAKSYARRRGVSLSSIIESALTDLTSVDEEGSFVERWRGSMKLADHPGDERLRALLDKYA